MVHAVRRRRLEFQRNRPLEFHRRQLGPLDADCEFMPEGLVEVVVQPTVSQAEADENLDLAFLRQIVRIQAWRRGQLGRVDANAYKLHVSACNIQRAWRCRTKEKVHRTLTSVSCLAQHRWREAAYPEADLFEAESEQVP